MSRGRRPGYQRRSPYGPRDPFRRRSRRFSNQPPLRGRRRHIDGRNLLATGSNNSQREMLRMAKEFFSAAQTLLKDVNALKRATLVAEYEAALEFAVFAAAMAAAANSPYSSGMEVKVTIDVLPDGSYEVISVSPASIPAFIDPTSRYTTVTVRVPARSDEGDARSVFDNHTRPNRQRADFIDPGGDRHEFGGGREVEASREADAFWDGRLA